MLIPLIIFGILLGGAVYFALRLYARADPGRLATAVNATAIAFSVLGIILMLLRARVGLLLFGVAGGMYVVAYLHSLWLGRRGLGGPSGSVPAPIVTKYLNVVRDANTGKFYGTVLAGRHRGRRLTELSFEQLLEVRDECRRDDPDAARLVEAYLDQSHGTAWRAREGDAAPSGMSREEAYATLGLRPGAGEADIRAAYQRLMSELGPEDEDLAAKINRARDLLLGPS